MERVAVVIEPVEIQITRKHPYKKRPSGRGCAECGQAKYSIEHARMLEKGMIRR